MATATESRGNLSSQPRSRQVSEALEEYAGGFPGWVTHVLGGSFRDIEIQNARFSAHHGLQNAPSFVNCRIACSEAIPYFLIEPLQHSFD